MQHGKKQRPVRRRGWVKNDWSNWRKVGNGCAM